MLNYEFKINGDRVFTDSENRSIVLTLDKSLDYGKFTLPNSTRSEPYGMLDYVSVKIDDSTTLLEYDFIVESDFVTKINKRSLTRFNHPITLIEPTKITEYYVVGNRAMTQPQTGTKASVWDRLFELQQTVPFEKDSLLDSTRIYDLGSSLNSLKDIEAEEIFLNNFTLRESNDKIMDTVKGVSRLKRKIGATVAPFWTLEIDFFNELQEEVDRLAAIVSQDKEQNINQYATKIDTFGSNQVYDGSDNGGLVVEPSPSGFNKIDSENALIDSSNSAVYYKSNQPKRQKIKVEMRVDTLTAGIKVIDITDRVQETDIRDTYKRTDSSVTNIYLHDYQSNTMIWNFNSNRITNLYEEFTGTPVIKNVIIWGLTLLFGGDTAEAINQFSGIPSPSELEFRVTYKPLFTSRSQVEKQDTVTSGINKDTTKIVNQSANILSANKSLDFSWTNAQQFGLSTETTNDTSEVLSEIFDIGDYEDGFILTKLELFLHNGFYNAKYEWTNNFQKLSELLRVNSTIELFEIPSNQRTLERNEYYAEYVEVGTTDEANTSMMGIGEDVFMNTMNNSASSTNDKPILGMAYDSDDVVLEVDPITGDKTGLGTNENLWLPITSYAGGNSLNFLWKYDSPNVAGKQIQIIDSLTTLRAVQYTDEFGQVENITPRYIYDFDSNKEDLPVILKSDINTTVANASDNGFTVFKNGGDILSMTYALHVIPTIERIEDIIIGDQLIKRNNLIELRDGTFPTLAVIGNDGRYNKFENKVSKGAGVGKGYSIVDNSIVLNSDIATDNWALVEVGTNKLYLAVNQLKADGSFENISTVYFNFRNKRSDVTYDY